MRNLLDSCLRGSRVLLVEDDLFQNLNLSDVLNGHACTVVGPAYGLGAAFALLENESFDAAILDIALSDAMVFPLAIELQRRDVPFIFVSAYTDSVERPPEVEDVPSVKKPYTDGQVVRALEQAMRTRSRSGHAQAPRKAASRSKKKRPA